LPLTHKSNVTDRELVSPPKQRTQSIMAGSSCNCPSVLAKVASRNNLLLHLIGLELLRKRIVQTNQ